MVGWALADQMDGAKMVPTSASTSKAEEECKNGPCQFLFLWREFQQTFASLAEALGLANESPLHMI